MVAPVGCFQVSDIPVPKVAPVINKKPKLIFRKEV